jgi:hypothetical protein
VIKQPIKKALALVLLVSLLGCSATAQKPLELSERQKMAMAMFQERCKKAGEFIYRTASEVDGVFLLKVRPSGINYGDQFALSDPYGRDLAGEGGFIGSFLRGSYRGDERVDRSQRRSQGYLYVEAVDPRDGIRYRYTGAVKDVVRTMSVMNGGDGKTQYTSREFVVERFLASGAMPRYGITYDDISTSDERQYWIAGSSLKVIDLQTNELMAERVGYMIDIFQGDRAGGRSPWLFAADHACPPFGDRYGASRQAGQTDRFVEKILKPAN